MTRVRPKAVAGTAVALLLTGCGISGDSELRQIDTNDLAGLDETTTSTTSTTTTTTAPVTPGPPLTTTAGATTTTIATEPVTLYFVDGTRLAAITVQLAQGPSPQRVLAALEAGPRLLGDTGVGLRSVVPVGLVNTVVDSGAGYVTVDLAAEALDRIDPADQRTAIAQIVLTLVGPNGRPGVGQVRFTLDGEPLRVPRSDDLQSAPGEPVSRLDYQSLLQQIEPAATTTTAPPPPPPIDTTIPT